MHGRSEALGMKQAKEMDVVPASWCPQAGGDSDKPTGTTTQCKNMSEGELLDAVTDKAPDLDTCSN